MVTVRTGHYISVNKKSPRKAGRKFSTLKGMSLYVTRLRRRCQFLHLCTIHILFVQDASNLASHRSYVFRISHMVCHMGTLGALVGLDHLSFSVSFMVATCLTFQASKTDLNRFLIPDLALLYSFGASTHSQMSSRVLPKA